MLIGKENRVISGSVSNSSLSSQDKNDPDSDSDTDPEERELSAQPRGPIRRSSGGTAAPSVTHRRNVTEDTEKTRRERVRERARVPKRVYSVPSAQRVVNTRLFGGKRGTVRTRNLPWPGGVGMMTLERMFVDMPADLDVFLATCEALERLAGQMYGAMSVRFPDRKSVLEQLAQAEERHARGIARMRVQLNAKAAPFAPPENAREGLAALERLLANITVTLSQPKTTYPQALRLALSFEMSLLERGFFRLMRESLPSETALLDQLNRETQNHFQELLRELQSAAPAAGANPLASGGGLR